jgi:hypothetical protein
MDIELKDYFDLEKAYQGRYEGDDMHLRRISNEVKAMKGEYQGFGTYLQRLSKEAKDRQEHNKKPFPTLKVAISLASLAAASIGLFFYLGRVKKNGRARTLF